MTTTNRPLDSIVTVSLSLDAFPVERAGFGTPLFIGTTDPDTNPATKVNAFTSLAEVLEIYDQADPEYLAAAAFFGQNPKPTRMLIGYKETSESWVEALADIRAIDDSWFFLTASTRTVGDQAALAAAVNGIAGFRQAHFVSNDTSDVLDGAVTTDIGSVLNANGYLTSFPYYHPTATVYPELATLGRVSVDRDTIKKIPGSVPIEKVQVASVTPKNYSSAQRTVLNTKRYTFFQSLAQVTRAEGGRGGAGVHFDTVYFLGWLSARLSENVTELLTRASDRGEKVPYTDFGIDMVESAMREVLDLSVQANVLLPDYTLTMPTRAETPFVDRVNRTLNNADFTANLAGSIDKVNINGILVA